MILLPRPDFDVIVIGSGPAGLASGLATAREGLRTLILGSHAPGGLAALTTNVENYPGFDAGISGGELTERMHHHAEHFGAEIRAGVSVQGLSRSRHTLTLKTTVGKITAAAVVIATGATPKFLGVPGEKDFAGHGVHYCASCDGSLYHGKKVVATGHGEAALQEIRFLARRAEHITVIEDTLEFKGPGELRDEVFSMPNIFVAYQSSITGLSGKTDDANAGLAVVETTSGTIEAEALFIFNGLTANAGWLGKTLETDSHGFIKTAADYSTNLPGVFAAGDVRSGAIWEIASAVGEGTSAAAEIRNYLDRLRP